MARTTLIYLLQVLAISCASGGETTAEVVSTEFEASSKVTYENLDVLEKQITHTVASMYLSGRDYGDSVEAQRLSAAEALRLLSDADSAPAWTIELVKQPGAVAYFYDLPDKPDIPTGLVFIPTPAAGFEHSEMPRGPGYLAMFGVEHRGEPNPALARVTPEFHESPKPLPSLGPKEFRAKIDAGESFTFLLSSNGCGAYQAFFPLLATLIVEFEVTNMYDVPDTAFADEADKALLESFVDEFAYPTLVHVKNGKPHALRRGGGQGPIAYWRTVHFFGEAGVIEPAVDWVVDMRGEPKDRSEWHRALAIFSNDLTLTNFDGADLAGAYLPKANLRHSRLRGANLRNANLAGADLTGADLTGADLTGADLSDVVFSNTVCQDGTTTSDACRPSS